MITTGIAKFLKKKHKLYGKFSKKRSDQNGNTKHLKIFLKLKREIKKKLYYFAKLIKTPKKTWAVMKKLIGKSKRNSSNPPQEISINNTDIFS